MTKPNPARKTAERIVRRWMRVMAITEDELWSTARASLVAALAKALRRRDKKIDARLRSLEERAEKFLNDWAAKGTSTFGVLNRLTDAFQAVAAEARAEQRERSAKLLDALDAEGDVEFVEGFTQAIEQGMKAIRGQE